MIVSWSCPFDDDSRGWNTRIKISQKRDEEEIFQYSFFFLLFFFSFFHFNLSVTINTTREIFERNTEIANFVKFFVQAGLSYFHFERRFTCLEIASTNEI